VFKLANYIDINPFESPEEDVRFDSDFIDLVGAEGRRSSNSNRSPYFMSYKEKAKLFDTNSFCQAICSVIPKRAVSCGWKLVLPNEETDTASKIQDKIAEYEARLAVLDSLEGGDQDMKTTI
jgi:hypothetical protein